MLSNTEVVDTTKRYIRIIMGFIDRIVFSILASLFDVFFSMAKQEIISADLLKSLIGRFQLIIGVIFLFVFAIHIVQGIINPDLFTDSNRGTSKVISKIIISLFLFASMIPLNIPNAAAGSYEEQLSNQGILFGTLSFFQNRVLEANVLAKLILGNSGGNNSSFGYKYCTTDPKTGEETCDDSVSFGEYTSTMLAKLFVFPNMMPDATSIQQEENGNLYAICIDDEGFYNEPEDGDESKRGRYQWYTLEDKPANIFGYVDNECTVSEDVDYGQIFGNFIKTGTDLNSPTGGWGMALANVVLSLNGQEHWQFQYLSPFSTVVGIFLIFMMVSTTVEIAIRMFKLVILRILGPVAALSYAGPGETNKAFSSWTTNLVTTYIDVFVRLLIVYFVLFIISTVLTSGIGLSDVGLLGVVFIIIALFAFAKQAPKYVRQVLGLPESSNGMFGGLFGGIGNMLAAGGTIAGLAATGLGAIGAARNAALSSREADEERKRLGKGVDPDAGWNKAKHFLAGALGLGQGVTRGASATFGADKNKLGAANAAITELNALKAARGKVGSTLLGRMGETVSSLGTGRSSLEKQEKQIAYYNGVSSTARNLADYVKKKAVGDYGDNKSIFKSYDFKSTDANGNNFTMSGLKSSYNDILNARAEARAKGNKTFNVGTAVFNTEGQATDDFVDEAAGRLSSAWGHEQDSLGKKGDAGFRNYYQSAKDNGVEQFINNRDNAVSAIFHDPDDVFDSYKMGKASGAASGEAKAIENSAEYALNKANQSGGPK